MNAYDREEEALERDLADGVITLAQFREGMRGMADEIRGAAEEAAAIAYQNEIGRW